MACVQNPDYGNYNDPLALFPDVQFVDSVSGYECSPYSIGNINGGTVYGSPTIPQVQINQGGYNVNNTTFDKILANALSGLALLTGAKYVPTATQPTQQPLYYPTGNTGGNLNSGNLGSNNASITAGTVGKVEAWVKKNPGAAAIGGLVAAALFLPALMNKKH